MTTKNQPQLDVPQLVLDAHDRWSILTTSGGGAGEIPYFFHFFVFLCLLHTVEVIGSNPVSHPHLFHLISSDRNPIFFLSPNFSKIGNI